MSTDLTQAGSGTCPICRSRAAEAPTSGPGDLHLMMDCPRCGKFELTGRMQAVLMNNPLTLRRLANASGWMRQNQGALLTITDEQHLRALPTPTVAERGELLLRHFARTFPRGGQEIPINLDDPALLAVTWTEDRAELRFIALDYLVIERQLLASDAKGGFARTARITPKGWAYLESLDLNPESPHGFVAMAFRPELAPLYDQAIRPAVEAAGYDALRIDRKRHENIIDDEIIASIRRSRFLIADFTYHSNGVYYEAGYSRGLGLKVIRICRDTDLAAVHFDQSHYHIQPWKTDRLGELARELRFRIEAAVGRGPRAGAQER